MWLLAFLLIADSTRTFTVSLTETEYLSVSMTGTGVPVVLVPGLFGSRYTFRRLTPLLADAGFRPVVIEPLGIGASARPARADYSLTAQADRMAAALDSLGVRHAIVAAHAVSVSIALRLALRRPDLVAGVVALDGGPAEAAATPGFRRAMRLAPLLRLFGGTGTIRKRVHKYMLTASRDTSWVTPETVDGYTADAARDLGATLDAFTGMARAREPQLLIPALDSIRAPVRLVAGAWPHEGAVPPAEITLMAERLRSFAVDSLPDVGHFAFEENPAAVVASVRRVALGLVFPLWLARP
jgi:pimeloyl-ACP methyl ester carboxylesterase